MSLDDITSGTGKRARHNGSGAVIPAESCTMLSVTPAAGDEGDVSTDILKGDILIHDTAEGESESGNPIVYAACRAAGNTTTQTFIDPVFAGAAHEEVASSEDPKDIVGVKAGKANVRNYGPAPITVNDAVYAVVPRHTMDTRVIGGAAPAIVQCAIEAHIFVGDNVSDHVDLSCCADVAGKPSADRRKAFMTIGCNDGGPIHRRVRLPYCTLVFIGIAESSPEAGGPLTLSM